MFIWSRLDCECRILHPETTNPAHRRQCVWSARKECFPLTSMVAGNTLYVLAYPLDFERHRLIGICASVLGIQRETSGPRSDEGSPGSNNVHLCGR